jgi:outer membrane protein assembly factor BamB
MRFIALLLASLLLTPGLFADLVPVVEGEWPRWRGPFNTGVARGSAPVNWSDTENVKWKTDVPGKGHSSPVIWGNKLFITTAIPTDSPGEHRMLLLCYDRETGRLLWEKEAVRETPHEGHHGTYGSFASHSPVTDGETVIAFFGSRGVYAYDLDGNLEWSKDFPPMRKRGAFGEGTPPALHENVLLLTFDHEGDSFIVALDKNSGEQLWRRDRVGDVSNWAPPLVLVYEGRTQAIVPGTGKVRSYDLSTGEVIWEAAGLGLNGIPAPVVVDDVVIVMSGFRSPNLLAIRLGGEGDITDSEHILWTNTRANSYSSSPLIHDGIIYFITDNGFISAFDAKTGEAHYHQVRLPKPYQFKASIVGAGDKLYLSTENEDVVVLEMGKELKVVATNKMANQVFIASPAIADSKIYLRSETTLFAIE